MGVHEVIRITKLIVALVLATIIGAPAANANAQAGQDGNGTVTANPGTIKIGQYKYRDMVRISKRQSRSAAWRYYRSLSKKEQLGVRSSMAYPRVRTRIVGANNLDRVRKEIRRASRVGGRSAVPSDMFSAAQITGSFGPITLSVYADHQWTGERLYNFHQTMSWQGLDGYTVSNYSCNADGDAPGIGWGYEGKSSDCANGPAWGGQGWTQVGFKSQGKFAFCVIGLDWFGGGCLNTRHVILEQWGGFDGEYGTNFYRVDG